MNYFKNFLEQTIIQKNTWWALEFTRTVKRESKRRSFGLKNPKIISFVKNEERSGPIE